MNETTRKTVHMSVDIAGVLADWPRWRDAFVDDTGRRAKRRDIRAYLEGLAAAGVRVIPYGGGACLGWSDQTGCPGHPVDGEHAETCAVSIFGFASSCDCGGAGLAPTLGGEPTDLAPTLGGES